MRGFGAGRALGGAALGIDIDIVLTVFTVLAPAGAVAYALMGVLMLALPLDAGAQGCATRWLALPIAACLVGLIASATHLGTPANALYTLLGFGRSPLSNEIVAAVAFVALAWLHWLVSFARRLPRVVGRVWQAVASVAALWLVSRIAVVYSVPTIPTWDSPLVPWALWLTALTSGPVLCLGAMSFARVDVPRGWAAALVALAGAALAGGVAVLALEGAGLEGLRNSYGTAAGLVLGYAAYVAGFALLAGAGVAGAGRLALARRRSPAETAGPWALSIALVLVGVALARIPFYGMHMTVGL